jgi:hypothetical protein
MESTISLFRRLYDHLPPLLPEETKEKMGHALNHLEHDQTITLEEVEDTMIKFGYEVWPWNQAYKEFLALAENKVGEHFLLPKLGRGLRIAYRQFKEEGGTIRDLHSGNPAKYFTPEERTELCQGLIALQGELRLYVASEITGIEKKHYLQRVGEFKDLLENIEQTLEHLRNLADTEQDHPTLADEIRSQVRAFEHGLCLLAPELNYEAVCQSVDFFHGRKQHLTRMKGIHHPAKVDFYAQ